MKNTYKIGIRMGQIVGGIFTLAGFALTIAGISGAIEIVFQGKGYVARAINAGPGVVFAVLGCCLLIKYKPRGYSFLKRKTTIEESEHGKRRQVIEEIEITEFKIEID